MSATERLIAHVDMNAYFASVEQQANRYLRGKPIAVVRKPQRASVISAPSYEAKRFGVKTGMPTWEAVRLCPQLRIILEDPDKYSWMSGLLFATLKQFSPLLEVFSIDEAWIDLTQAVRDYRNPLHLAGQIKRRLRQRLGAFTRCSIGLASSKTLAKIASEWDKPNGLTWIRPCEVQDWLEQLDVDEACGINTGTKRRLAKLGVRTLAELGRCPPWKLRREFGILGHHLHMMGQGKDSMPLNPGVLEAPPKSFGHSRVLRCPHPTFAQAKDILALLCYKVARRMRAKGFAGRVVHFYAASPDDWGVGKQRALPVATADELAIQRTCLKIAEELDRTGQLPDVLQVVGVSMGKLCRQGSQPIQLFERHRRRERLLRTMDAINDEWGDFATYFGNFHQAKRQIVWNAANQGMHREVFIAT